MQRMVTKRHGLAFTACALSISSLAMGADKTGVHWPSFRGPNATGVADGYSLPTKWDATTGENIKWKRSIPGLAHSSPVIWGDRIFITTAVSADPNPLLRVGLYGESPDHPENIEHDFRVYCLDKKTGSIIWQKSAHKGIPKAKRHIKATQANCTPATDGQHVVAFFGSEGLYCYDVDGNLKWKKDLGFLDSGPPDSGHSDLQWGYSSSPIIHEDKVIVLCALRNESYVAMYDITDGRQIWRTPRKPYPGWGTPTVHVGKDRSQVITNGYLHIGGYDLENGKAIWWMKGGGDVPVPTPIVAHDLIFIANAHGGKSPVYAIRTSAEGDISLADDQTSNEHIAWTTYSARYYMQTPIVYGDEIYGCRNSGIMSCYDARTGEQHYRNRLAAGVGFTASPVAGDGKVYFTSEEGDVYIIRAGKKYKRLPKNSLGEICMATPAISEGNLFFRTKDHVIAIGR